MEDEEPQPSFIAPKPVPAPSSSADQSIDTFAATAPPGLVPPSGWQSAWRLSTRYADTAIHTGHGTPFTWRGPGVEAPVHLPAWKAHSGYLGSAKGEASGQISEVGGLTPKIRYRSSSATSAPGVSAAAPSPSSPSNSVKRQSPQQHRSVAPHLSTAPHITLGPTRGKGVGWPTSTTTRNAAGETVAEHSALDSNGWPRQQREHTVPAIAVASVSSLPSRTTSSTPKPFDAIAGINRGLEETKKTTVTLLLRPPPPLSRTRLVFSEATPSLTTGSSMKEPCYEVPSTAPLSASHMSAKAPELTQRAETHSGRKGNSASGTPRAFISAASAPQPSARTSRAALPIAEETNEAPYEAGSSDEGEASRTEQSYLGTGEAANAAAKPLALGHLTLRSLTEEYNQFSSEGTVGWVGLQVHLRRHTQATQITVLDLTCYRMQREQWAWFALEVLPQLQSLEVVRLVQMGLTDDDVANLVRGSCGGWCTNADSTHVSPARCAASTTPRPPSASPRGSAPTETAAIASKTRTSPLPFLRVLDLSGNTISQRSCNHLGKMLLWMADSLEEVRLLGNPLKDYGMQTLAIYVAKLNVETLRDDSGLFPEMLRHKLRLAQEQPPPRRGEGAGSVEAKEESKEMTPTSIDALPIGLVLLDVRDCRASPRGLTDILAAASRAHRLRTVIMSHNVAGVTALLPLPATAFKEALDMISAEAGAAAAAAATNDDNSCSPHRLSCTSRLGPAPRRLRLAKTPLISSGALLRRQHAAFSDVPGFAPSCALSTLVFHSVPLSQTCSPVGCRELLLNVFFSCQQLELMDLSDTFERSLVPTEEQQRLVMEANRRDAVEQRLRGPEVQRGLQMYREDQGEAEFVLDSVTVAGQTRLGDVFGELMAHAAYNAVVRKRLVPAAFAHVRELDLSNTGLTDAGVRGLCVSVRRGRTRTGMLASLTVLNLSDNLLTVRGCLRVISSFLLEDAEGEGSTAVPESGLAPNDNTEKTASAAGQAGEWVSSVPIAPMTALALQRNAGVEGEDEDDWTGGMSNGVNGYVTDGTSQEEGVAFPGRQGSSDTRPPTFLTRESSAYLSEVCTAAETAVLRRATLRSVARGSDNDSRSTPPLTVYFSAPCLSAWGSSGVHGDHAARRRPSTSTSNHDVSVYYAGFDERGDIFCTCPRSRFFVPKVDADRLVGTNAQSVEVQLARQQPPPFQHLPPSTSVATTAPSQTAAANNTAVGDIASGVRRTNSPLYAKPDTQRSLLSALDAPRSPSMMQPRSQLLGGRARELFTTPDVRLPLRPTADAALSSDATGLVNSAALHPSVSSVGDALITSLSFPPPPSVSAYSADSAAARPPQPPQSRYPPAQQLPLHIPQGSRRDSLVSITSTSPLGSLFMDKTAPREDGNASEDVDAAAAAPAANDATDVSGKTTAQLDTAAAVTESAVRRVDRDGDDQGAESDNVNSPTARSGKRRTKVRQNRVFVLSYDHPAGHLLCRALGVLVRPAPDPLGAAARAALDADLLSALRRACARSSAYPGGDDDGDHGDGGSGKASPRIAAITVESVKYLPPDFSVSGTENATEAHWMRFEITTNERRARMAQRLQEVLNVSWAAQCVRFANLLQWLRAHVMERSSNSGGIAAKHAAASGMVVVEWDPVQMIERAARVSADVRTRLDTLYAGSAAAAVHAHHQADAGGGFCSAVGGEAGVSATIALAQLHPQLWKEVGLQSDAAAVEQVNDRAVAGAAPRDAASSVASPFRAARRNTHTDAPTTAASGRDDMDGRNHGEAGEDLYSAISASEDPSYKSAEQDKDEISRGTEEEEAASGRRVSVVDFYAETASSGKAATLPIRGPTNNAKLPAAVEERVDNTAAAVALPFLSSTQRAETSAAAASSVDVSSHASADAVVISTSLTPGSPVGQRTPSAAMSAVPTTDASPPATRPFVSVPNKVFRNFDELSDSDDEERVTPSTETPEKQPRACSWRREVEGPSTSLLQLQPQSAPHVQGDDAQADAQLRVQSPVHVGSPLAPQTPPAKEAAGGDDDDGAVLTDQLMGPPSPPDGPLSRKELSVVAAVKQEKQIVSREEEGDAEVAGVRAAVTSRAQREVASGDGSRDEPREWEGRVGSRSNTPESRRIDRAQSGSPSAPGSRQRAQAAKGALPPSSLSPPSVAAEATTTGTADERQSPEEGKDEGEGNDIAVFTPIRVHRHPSDLEGRVKTFTLSYTHQEGTAVCRAWRLLHSALGGDAVADTRSPTSPTFVALAQEARDCLCDDFLAFLQPPDEDAKHAVLSVTLHSDSGAATAMLQVQVQTNERRATLANRLQDSNHGVRRNAGGRAGAVPLTVDQVDVFYFPRLTRLLRRNKMTADTVAQVEKFLETRPVVQGRLMKSYGSIGSLVHYYHGSTAALEHELGISSWRELAGSAPAAPPAGATKLQAEVSSPTVAKDRVMPQLDSGGSDRNNRISGDAKGKDYEDEAMKGNGDEGTPGAVGLSEMKKISSGSVSLRLNPATPTQQLQGRPPPHPRRPPTPPNPITHTDSISFDEVTEELTSEAGPVVVLRGSTPSITARSPSTPNTRNPQYYPAGYRSAAGMGEPRSPHFSESMERDRQHDVDSDPGALSPMTSTPASPSMPRLSGASPPPHTQQTLKGAQLINTIKDKSNNKSSSDSRAEGLRKERDIEAETPSSSPSPQTPPKNVQGGTSGAPEPPPRLHPQPERTPSLQPQQDHHGRDLNTASNPNHSRQVSGSSNVAGAAAASGKGKSEYERVLEGKYKRLMRVAYDGVARGSVPLEPQHQQKTVIGRGKWRTQKVELSLEWEILFVLTFEKSRAIGRSSRRAQMVVHPVGFGFECMSGDEYSHQGGGNFAETSSLHSSMVNTMTTEGSGIHHPPAGSVSQISKGSRTKKDSASSSSKSAASHLIIMIQRPFSPNEVGSSSAEIEKTLMAGALLTVPSSTSLSRAARLLGGGGNGGGGGVADDASNTSRGSTGVNQVAQDMVYQLCQRSLTLDIEMKSAKHVQEALRLLKNSIRRATQAVKKSMSNAHVPPPPPPS
jgi:hypothetical protein